MKRNNILLTSLSLLLLAGCADLYDAKYVTDIDEDVVWTIPDMAKGILFDAYYYRPERSKPDIYASNFLDVATDNAVTGSFGSNIYYLSLGQQTADNNPFSTYTTAYEAFQMIHKFLENGLGDNLRYVEGNNEVAVWADADYKELLRGEAYYLRAWWGLHLLQHYGGRTLDGRALGYPIVTKYIDPDAAADLSSLKRNTYQECVAQICSDCDEAVRCLTGKEATTGLDDYLGRATIPQTEFVKMRTLFLAAQPAYQEGSVVTIEGMGKYSVNDRATYEARWKRALDQIQYLYALLGSPNYAPLRNSDLADVTNTVTPAQFVHRYYSSSNSLESRHYPPFYFGSCNTMPSQNLVDAYPMRSGGYPITHKSSGYDPQKPFTGRDSRLESTVYHHGQTFGNTSTAIDIKEGGKDAPGYLYNNERGSRTGYYLHKWLSEKNDLLNPISSSNSQHFWPTMRVAEVIFDLAEASNELYGPKTPAPGSDKSAYDIIKDVRSRSGGISNDKYIDEVSTDKDSFLGLIMNERRLEFAFEHMRYWDLRRRLLPLKVTIQGMRAVTAEDGTLRYEVVDVEERDFDNVRFYYNPLPLAEIRKGPEMVNNMDY